MPAIFEEPSKPAKKHMLKEFQKQCNRENKCIPPGTNKCNNAQPYITQDNNEAHCAEILTNILLLGFSTKLSAPCWGYDWKPYNIFEPSHNTTHHSLKNNVQICHIVIGIVHTSQKCNMKFQKWAHESVQPKSGQKQWAKNLYAWHKALTMQKAATQWFSWQLTK